MVFIGCYFNGFYLGLEVWYSTSILEQTKLQDPQAGQPLEI
jgi:hypothetical protein